MYQSYNNVNFLNTKDQGNIGSGRRVWDWKVIGGHNSEIKPYQIIINKEFQEEKHVPGVPPPHPQTQTL